MFSYELSFSRRIKTVYTVAEIMNRRTAKGKIESVVVENLIVAVIRVTKFMNSFVPMLRSA